MRRLLSRVALWCAMALAFGAFAPRADAAQLSTGVLALKNGQTDAMVVQKARYRCWWRHGYRHCGNVHHRRWWRHHARHRHHRHWRHRYLHNRHWRHRHAWRQRHYGHRHYYYRSYYRPHARAYYRPHVYCIGLCWW
ncbi:MAG TPA: hypothetical protein VM620_12250 [Hyphomicrobium sp.]|nr:hypothetical protein [Hyphomicrobium sp.]